ncbi:MAG: radical SAM protein [Armatimonadota bacterium]
MITKLKEKIVNRYPVLYNVEISTRCNLKCIMCEYRYWDTPGRDMSLKEFKTIYSRLPWQARKLYPHLLRFQLSGIGEVFMNKEALDIIEFIKEKGAFITFAENFTAVCKGKASMLVDMGVDEIFISLDGATKDVYEKIRCGARFDKVIENIKRVVEIKKEKKASLPRLVIRFVPLKTNIHQLSDMVKLTKELGIEEMEVPSLYLFEGNKDLSFDPVEFEKYSKEALKTADELGISLDIFGDKEDISECKRVENSTYITCEGEILPCCALNQRNIRDSIKKYSFGNVYKESISSIWDSGRYKRFRASVLTGDMPRLCEGCYWYESKCNNS